MKSEQVSRVDTLKQIHLKFPEVHGLAHCLSDGIRHIIPESGGTMIKVIMYSRVSPTASVIFIRSVVQSLYNGLSPASESQIQTIN